MQPNEECSLAIKCNELLYPTPVALSVVENCLTVGRGSLIEVIVVPVTFDADVIGRFGDSVGGREGGLTVGAGLLFFIVAKTWSFPLREIRDMIGLKFVAKAGVLSHSRVFELEHVTKKQCFNTIKAKSHMALLQQ